MKKLYKIYKYYNGEFEIQSVNIVKETPKLYIVDKKKDAFDYRTKIRKNENLIGLSEIEAAEKFCRKIKIEIQRQSLLIVSLLFSCWN